jgi:predicted double-glycine peptidase
MEPAMPPFRLLTRTRQATEYSCGACALQAVLGYWGKEVDETELMRLMGTNEDVGTHPENMVRGAKALGFGAEAHGGTLAALRLIAADALAKLDRQLGHSNVGA